MRKILLLSTLLLSSNFAFAEPDDQPKLVLKGEVYFIGEITEETCALNYDRVARTTSPTDIEKSLTSNCRIKEGLKPTHLSRIKAIAFNPVMADQKALENYSFFASEYL